MRGARTCPDCSSPLTKVYDVKDHPGGKTVRRHLCRSCGLKFRTVQEHAKFVGWVREAHI